MGTDSVGAALARFRASGSGWLSLPFFAGTAADAVAERVDARIAAGATVLPSPGDVFNALVLTPPDRVKAVVLGQDPYPTPGDAHGLAFSYVGPRRLPASLKVILAEAPGKVYSKAAGSIPVPARGDLTPWAERGVLLLNAALTVEAGKAGAHLRYGWSTLIDEVAASLSAGPRPVVFLLWGAQARARAALVDGTRHGVVESGHPSPLNRLRDFAGSRPFDRANAWLLEHGVAPIDWDLG